MREYPLRITSEHDIPDDVLVEHIAVALRDFEFAGKVDVKMARQHPFDGPEVFDDHVPEGARRKHSLHGDEYVLTAKQVEAIGGAAGVERLIKLARSADREANFSPTDIGARELLENSGIEDPYPLTTRVVDKLKETRRHGND